MLGSLPQRGEGTARWHPGGDGIQQPRPAEVIPIRDGRRLHRLRAVTIGCATTPVSRVIQGSGLIRPANRGVGLDHAFGAIDRDGRRISQENIQLTVKGPDKMFYTCRILLTDRHATFWRAITLPFVGTQPSVAR